MKTIAYLDRRRTLLNGEIKEENARMKKCKLKFGSMCVYINSVLLLAAAFFGGLRAQEDYADLSLDDLLSVEVIEAITKKPEVLFEAPLDVSVLKQEEIVRSGATSIPDALRLLPGIIVREQTPGNYDVHIRGFDNATVNSMLPFPSNMITLVMIDYRVVYNYFASGTFWETLPINIQDVNRIEVIRGPSSALYGPNAVAGVINIVTNRPEQDGLYANVVSQVGTNSTYLMNGAVGFGAGGIVDGVFSASYNLRDRHASDYYEWASLSYSDVDSLNSILAPDDPVENVSIRYPNPQRSLENYSVNGSVRYKVSNKSSIVLSSGRQSSEAQKVYVNTLITPLSTNTSTTNFADLKVLMEENTRVQLSYLQGEQSVNGMPDWQYDMNVFEAVAEHEFSFWNDKLGIRPSISYRAANYVGDFIGGSHNIINSAGSILADIRPVDKLRFLGAFRIDHYEHSDDLVPSYQVACTFMPNVKNIFRGVAYYANKAPSMLETYITYSLPQELATIKYLGNAELQPLNMNTFEVGWRTKMINSLELDIEGFVSLLDGFGDLLYSETRTDRGGLQIEYEYVNHDLQARQFGGTVSVSHKFKSLLDSRIYATVQATDYPEGTDGQLKRELDTDLQTTPTLFGGIDLDFSPHDRINLNFNGTYSSSQQFKGLLGTDEIEGFFNANAAVQFRVWKELELTGGIRNIFSSGEKEYGYADQIERTFLAGIKYTL